MTTAPSASILVPTRDRPEYLEVALRSIVPQARDEDAEVLVIDDGEDGVTRPVAERHGVRVVIPPPPGGLNAARNAGIAAAGADLIVLVDDDVAVRPGWLRAVIDGATGAPDHDVFGGPIRAALQGGGPRRCGREGAPITTLDLGVADRDAERVWGANMALRRRAWTQVGAFDETVVGPGDEEEWERRYLAAGGRIRYLAAAGVDHRRTGRDATLARLVPAGFRQGRAARRDDVRRGTAPSLRAELRTLAGCAVHVVRFRCANMIAVGAHAAGRVREALGAAAPRPTSGVVTEDFLSGESGEVSGIRATARAALADLICDAVAIATLTPWRLRRAARATPRRRVLVLAIERADGPNLLAAARAELLRSHHEVSFHAKEIEGKGKFENLDELLARHPAAGHDWLLVIDDDVALPPGFLDVFVFLSERFDLTLAQPAHRWRSHAAWRVTRRRPGLVARETRFVEIGPVSAFHARTFETLLPFPPLRFGWGLELHWSVLAAQRGWREGVIDATAVTHGIRRVASAYTHDEAIDEARRFLAGREYTRARDAQHVLGAHREWR